MKVIVETIGEVFWINLSGDGEYQDADSVDFCLTERGIEIYAGISEIDDCEVFLERTAYLNAAELDRLIHNLLILREKMENM